MTHNKPISKRRMKICAEKLQAEERLESYAFFMGCWFEHMCLSRYRMGITAPPMSIWNKIWNKIHAILVCRPAFVLLRQRHKNQLSPFQ